MSETASDGWGLREMTRSRVGRMGGSRWMTVDSWIVVDRHGCPSGRLNRDIWQGLRLIDTRNEGLGRRNRGGDPSRC